jgi:pimeloyl-ACP methyl ester carboxylesterase
MKRTFLRGARFGVGDVPAEIERIPVELVAQDAAISRAMLYRRRGTRPTVGVLMLHPRMDQTQSYVLLPIMAAGYAAMGCACRYVHNDTSSCQERLVLDVAAAVKALRDSGCEKVILIGNSGGGGILSLYQAQARTAPEARLKDTPAGEAFDLGAYDLPPADGLVLIAAHRGEGSRLYRWIDAAQIDEDDPMSLDPSLDIYNPDNGFRLPPESSHYSEEFLVRYREAQHQRALRMDARARERIAARHDAAREAAALEAAGDTGARWQELTRRSMITGHMVITRMLACPEWLDLSIEPDDRVVCSFNNDPRPDLQNYEESFAPFLTPEAFLSTWSGLSSRADVVSALPSIPDPFLVVHYAGDPATRISEVEHFIEVSGASDKHLELIRGADHWGYEIVGPGQRGPRTTAGTDAIVAWMSSRFPLG